MTKRPIGCRELALALVVCLGAIPAAAEFDVDAALLKSKQAVGQALPAVTFVDPRGRPVTLAQFRGKPLIVSMIYTSCPGICPMITEYLAEAVDMGEKVLGSASFNVITVGFDVDADTPARMRMFAASHGEKDANWMFLSGDDESIAALAEATGFAFEKTPWGFDHATQVSIVDAAGLVRAQVYGADFAPQFLVEPLKRLVLGYDQPVDSLERVVDRIRFFCTVYDPKSGRYRFDYAPIIALVLSGLTLLLIGGVAVRAWLRTGAARGV
jgi:protein SCO1/2